MKIDLSSCSEEELWKYIASALAEKEIDVVLVGGAVVSVYTEGAYRSGDLDFVLNDFTRDELNLVLKNLGFLQEKGRYYKHPKCKHLFLEFASFPVSIGDDFRINPAEVEHEGKKIKIFSPTDCVRDRLASFAYFKSRDNLDQAVMVAKKHSVDYSKIKKWCEDEKIVDKYHEFLEELKRP